jgi:nitrogen fixation/metabolism regulation signal transduction histidine kinase
MKEAKLDRRKNYFIERSFQAKFIVKFCILVGAGGLLTIGMLYLLAMRSTTVAIVNSEVLVKTTADFLLPILIQTVSVVVFLVSITTIIVTLFVSHKIAGPLYRLKKAMHDLGEGDFSAEINLRRFDQLKDIAQDFNNMARRLKSRLSD